MKYIRSIILGIIIVMNIVTLLIPVYNMLGIDVGLLCIWLIENISEGT